MKDFEVKNCGCNQDPCKTYGSEEEQKAEYEKEHLQEDKMRNPSMKLLLTEWRKLMKENYDYDIKFDEEYSQAVEMFSEMKQQGLSKDEIYNRLVARFMREVVDSVFGY